MINKKIGIIGLGNMGKMLVEGFLRAGALKEENTYVSTKTPLKLDQFKEKNKGVNVSHDNSFIAKESDCLFICVKPLEVKAVLQEIEPSLNKDKHIISIAACVTLQNLEDIYKGKVSKLIPTLVSEMNEGVSLICHNDRVREDERKNLEELVSSISKVKIINENDFELGADLTSCAPGLIAAIFSEFLKSALKHKAHFSVAEAEEMVVNTLYGTAKLILQKNIKFDKMISSVATKGGITQEGVAVLRDKLPGVFNEMFQATLDKHEVIKKIITESIDG